MRGEPCKTGVSRGGLTFGEHAPTRGVSLEVGMTIMTEGSNSGERRRCDATCHKARHPACACICGGRYHGKGSSEAAQEQLTKDWLGNDWREHKAAIEAAGGSFEAVVAEAFQGAPCV